MFHLYTRDQLVEFDSKVNKRIFIGYYDTSKAYIMFNSRTLVVEESNRVKLNDGQTTSSKLSDLEDDSLDMHIGLSVALKVNKVTWSNEILPLQ